MVLNNYLIDQQGLDLQTPAQEWAWLLPREYTVWLITRIGDMFIVTNDGHVHMLDVGQGTLRLIAIDRDDFARKLDEGNNANEWLAIPLVDKLVASGMRLKAGECYAYKTPPVLGGEYAVGNFGMISFSDFLGAYGSIHRQLKDLPNGTSVKLKVAD